MSTNSKNANTKTATIANSAVDPKAFVEAWQHSATVDEVADKLKVDKSTVQRRAHYFRKRGVPLKAMSAAGQYKIDWAELAEFAEQQLPEGAKTGLKRLNGKASSSGGGGRQKQTDEERRAKATAYQRKYRAEKRAKELKAAKKEAKQKPAAAAKGGKKTTKTVADFQKEERAFKQGAQGAQGSKQNEKKSA